ERRRMAREAPHRLLEGEYAEPPYPVPKQMQPEAGVVEEREVRAGIGERDEARRVAQHPADRFLVGVEKHRVEHRVEPVLEREVEHDVERVLAARFGHLPDAPVLEVLAAWRRHDFDLVPFAVEEAEVRRARELRANAFPEGALAQPGPVRLALQ